MACNTLFKGMTQALLNALHCRRQTCAGQAVTRFIKEDGSSVSTLNFTEALHKLASFLHKEYRDNQEYITLGKKNLFIFDIIEV